MAKFQKGDKVVRCDRWRNSSWAIATGNVAGVYVVDFVDDHSMRLIGVREWWDTDKFELYVEPQPEPVKVTEPPVQQIPGVPDGYRLVRIGAPKKGEWYVDNDGGVQAAVCGLSPKSWAIVEPIASPAPPTPIPSKVKVQLNRYLVGRSAKTHMVIECTAEFVDRHYVDYRLLGPSETLELEVEV